MSARFPRPELLLPVLLAAAVLLLCVSAASADAPADDDSRPGSKRPGFYIALDLGAAAFDLDDLVQTRFEDLDLELSESANGGGLALGWSFRDELALELQLFGGEVSSDRSDVEAALFQADLALRLPLRPRERVSPYLEGHLGTSGLVFSGDAIDNRVVFGANTGIGVGTEVHVGRRWAFDLGYRFSIIDFRREAIETRDGDREFDIEGTGLVHRVVIRTVFSF